MFESLALEDPRNTGRGWSTVVSFALQSAGIAVLILAPLGFTQAISLKIGEPLVAPSVKFTAVETRAPEHPNPGNRMSQPGPTNGIVYQVANTNIPRPQNPTWDTEQQVTPGPYIPGAIGIGGPNSTLASLLNSKPAPVHVANTRSAPLPVSHLDPGMLIKQVQPNYPHLAVITGTQGTVLLAAIIDTQGRVTNLRALSGHPYLIPAAVDAVKQWRYKPYVLNGSAIEVETQVSVIFTLQK